MSRVIIDTQAIRSEIYHQSRKHGVERATAWKQAVDYSNHVEINLSSEPAYCPCCGLPIDDCECGLFPR